ncbi:MAG TPA: methyltransferase, partial [Micromonosporaceae bacterium]
MLDRFATVRPEPGSFRDPANRVFYHEGQVLRGLDARAAEEWRALIATDFFPRLLAAGRICGSEALPAGTSIGHRWALVLRHERIPVVSYPYEWSFAMLRDAALLHLDILREAVTAGFLIKDGSAYNLQWRGSEPVFIDIGSFERARPGEPWAGYRQFCQTMLYPLLLQAHLGLDFQPWLRGRVDGIEAAQMRRLFRGSRSWRRGVLKHVHLHDALQSRNAAAGSAAIRDELRDAGYTSELVLATVRALDRLIHR